MSAPAATSSSSSSASKPSSAGRKRGVHSTASSSAAPESGSKRGGEKSKPSQDSTDDGDDAELDFEDPFGDEMDDDDEDQALVKKVLAKRQAKAKAKGKVTFNDAEATSTQMQDEGEAVVDEVEATAAEEEEDEAAEAATREAMAEEEAQEAASKQKRYVWRSTDKMNEDEQLDYDSSAYHLLHRMKVEWPCLSFDVLPDQLGAFRNKYPLTMYMVAGTQADKATNNKVMVLKASDLHRTRNDDREDDDDADASDSDDEDLDDDPTLEDKSFSHPGGVNRIRVCPQLPHIVATHADTAHVHLWNIQPYVHALDAPPATPLPKKEKPIFSFKFPTAEEGYSMAWNPHKTGRLIVGDGKKNIHLIDMAASKNFTADSASYVGHSSSVEDLVWSPSEENVFASCSSDRTIRIWDSRTKGQCQAWIAAHKQDVNVIDWNQKVQHLLVSGGDDGAVKIWDLRAFKSSAPAAAFNWHNEAITSVEWHPSEESCVAVSAEDSLTIWDMSLEHDELPGHGAQLQQEVPPQLFFVHQGQKNVKELHWHKQIPNLCISTAADGFNFFKPSNME